MKNELKINGFSAVTENEMMDVDGGLSSCCYWMHCNCGNMSLPARK